MKTTLITLALISFTLAAPTEFSCEQATLGFRVFGKGMGTFNSCACFTKAYNVRPFLDTGSLSEAEAGAWRVADCDKKMCSYWAYIYGLKENDSSALPTEFAESYEKCKGLISWDKIPPKST